MQGMEVFQGIMAEGLTVFAMVQLLTMALAFALATVFWNTVRAMLGYRVFKTSPFDEGMWIFHPTPVGSARALISSANWKRIVLRYPDRRMGRHRYIPMQNFEGEAVTWQLITPSEECFCEEDEADCCEAEPEEPEEEYPEAA
jgi:hypothetical protein